MKKDPTFVLGWLESENSVTFDFAINTFGLDPERVWYIEIDREGAGEVALDRIEAAMASGAISMMVINSLKCLTPSDEYKKQFGEHTIGLAARLNSKLMRKFTAIVAESDTAFVIVQHLSTQIGGYGDPKIITGGQAILYGASIILDLRKRSILDSDPIKREEGIKIGVSVKKNHCVPDRNPYLKTEYFAIFGQGIEQHLSTLETAVKQGVLIQGGAWIKDLDDETGEPKQWSGQPLNFQGKEKYRQFVVDNPDYLEDLKRRIRGEVDFMSEEEVALAKQEEEKASKAAAEIEKTESKKKTTPKKKAS